MFCYGQADSTRQLITITFNKVLKCLFRIQLGIKLLRRCGIQHRRCLIASSEGTRAFNLRRSFAIDILYNAMAFISQDSIAQNYLCTEYAYEYLT